MVLIENENRRLKGVLPKNFARPELDKEKLGNVVDLFTNINMKEHGDSKDILGRTYEYCLSMFASAEGKNAGEFYTPSCIVRTLVEVLKPYHGRVYDPACVQAVCSYNRPNSLKDIRERSMTFLSSVRNTTRRPGRWHK